MILLSLRLELAQVGHAQRDISGPGYSPALSSELRNQTAMLENKFLHI
jgi:hypothetical protein